MKDEQGKQCGRKIPYLALIALCLALAPVCSLFFLGGAPPTKTWLWLACLSLGLSIVIGNFVLSRSKRNGTQAGVWVWMAKIAKISVIVFMVLSMPSILYHVVNMRTCTKTITFLGKALMADAGNHDDKISKVANWCDLLVQDQGVYERLFICPNIAYVNGVSSYALNENVIGLAISDINPDTVLLFESKQGWNQTGGSELLTLENHDGKGCYVLFADQHVEYIKSKTVDELRWSP